MKVICKNIDNIITGTDNSLLTIDRVYDVIEYDSDSSNHGKCPQVCIIDDSGTKRVYNMDRFIDATAIIRQEELNQLGI